MKDPWLSVFLSKLFPGVGQMYAGARARGLFFIGVTILTYICLLAVVLVFLTSENEALFRTILFVSLGVFPVYIILSIYALFDAYKTTKRRNPAQAPDPVSPGQRKPWLTAFLSSIIPGLGHFYNRQWIKGTFFFAAAVGAAVLEERYSLMFILGVLVVLIAVKDAFDSAQRINGSDERFFNQQKQVVWFVVIMISLSAGPFQLLIREHLVQAFKIPSGAMLPTLMIGDCLLVAKTEAALASVQRGDIIVFPYPENPERNFIKRVIGIGGDKVEYVNGELFVNDRQVPSRRIRPGDDSEQPPSKEFGPPVIYEEQVGNKSYRVQYLLDKTRLNKGPWIVPQDAFFVMGDNRDNSMDSRVWGSVPRRTIIGKAGKLYWSWGRADKTVRWERIGQTIR